MLKRAYRKNLWEHKIMQNTYFITNASREIILVYYA